MEGHNDWVRDVAWAQSESQTLSTIASCGLVSLFQKNFYRMSQKTVLLRVFFVEKFSKITYKEYFHAIFENFSPKNAKVRFFGSSVSFLGQASNYLEMCRFE